jgi:hypothetical protein
MSGEGERRGIPLSEAAILARSQRVGAPHDHREYVEGCFRCDLSRSEIAVEMATETPENTVPQA